MDKIPEVIPGLTQVGGMSLGQTIPPFLSQASEGQTEEEPEEDKSSEEPELEEESAAEIEEEEETEEEEEETEEEETEEEEEGVEYLPNEQLDALVKLKDGNAVTVRELVAGYFRQAHFTKVMQEVRERERTLDAMLSELEEWKERNSTLEELDRLFRANPWLVQAIGHLWQGDLEAVMRLAQENQRILPQAPPQRTERGGAVPDEATLRLILEERWKRELAEIKAKYPDVKEELLWDALQYHTDENGVPSMWAAFRAVYFDRAEQRAKREGRKQAVRQMKKGAKTPSPMKGGTGTSSAKPRFKGDPAERAYQHYLQLMRE